MKSRRSPAKNLNPGRTREQRRRLHCKVLRLFLSNENVRCYEWSRNLDALIASGDWATVYSEAEKLGVESYPTAAETLAASQLCALVKKYPFDWQEIALKVSPSEAARETFRVAEERCRKTNYRLRECRSRFDRYLHHASEWILRCIGDSPDLQAVYSECRFTSGSSIGTHGSRTHLAAKLDGPWTVTPGCVPYALASVLTDEQLFLNLVGQSDPFGSPVSYDRGVAVREAISRLSVVRHNKVSFVPKTAKTDRSIAVEPLLNSYIQKGIDSVLRKKLRRFGVDLSNQARNQNLARLASIRDDLATVDLSSASDTVSTALVRRLLPPAWYELLNHTRSCEYSLDGKFYRYEKFVSMGNGFCFPLESLIFASLLHSLNCEFGDLRDWAVYGDDIILPSERFPLFRDLLRYCGFLPNKDKTFHCGPFRESCGADWYKGQDVRPVYLDYELTDVVKLMIFHNATLRSDSVACLFTEVRGYLRNQVPWKERLCRPLWYEVAHGRVPPGTKQTYQEKASANGAFSVEPDVFMSSVGARWHRGLQCWSWREYLHTPVKDQHVARDHPARYIAFLSGSSGGELFLRYTAKLSFTNKM